MFFRPNRVPAFALVAIIGWCAAARAQQPTPATPPPTDTSAPAPATPPPPDQTQPHPPPPQLQLDQTQSQPPEAAPQPPAKPAFYAKDAKGKPVYVGPKDPIELPPTPVLDEEGRQRLDLDGQPMFNKPVFQLRDKKGHPVFDDQGKPVFQTPKDLGYTAEGKKIDVVKEKPPKTIAVHITHGTLTVDGLTGKAQLNYDISDLKYIYFYVPWIGTTVVSNVQFPGSKEQKDAFVDKTLTVTVGDHTLQLYSDARLLDKKPQPAYVLLDRDFKLPTQYPVMGYGPRSSAPFEWPGAKQNQAIAGTVPAPQLPENLRPVQLLSACPQGQMRMPGPKPLPGQTAQVQPCVPIEKAIPGKPKAPAAEQPPAAPAPSPTDPAQTSPAPTAPSTQAPLTRPPA